MTSWYRFQLEQKECGATLLEKAFLVSCLLGCFTVSTTLTNNIQLAMQRVNLESDEGGSESLSGFVSAGTTSENAAPEAGGGTEAIIGTFPILVPAGERVKLRSPAEMQTLIYALMWETLKNSPYRNQIGDAPPNSFEEVVKMKALFERYRADVKSGKQSPVTTDSASFGGSVLSPMGIGDLQADSYDPNKK